MTTAAPPDLDLTADERAWLDGEVERTCEALHPRGFGLVFEPCHRPAVAIAVYMACPCCGHRRTSVLVCQPTLAYATATCLFTDGCNAARAVTYVERLR